MIPKKRLMQEAWYNPERYRQLKLSPMHIKILDYMENEQTSITSIMLSEELDITIPNASTRLAELHKKGYISKTPTEQSSGGLINQYKLCI